MAAMMTLQGSTFGHCKVGRWAEVFKLNLYGPKVIYSRQCRPYQVDLLAGSRKEECVPGEEEPHRQLDSRCKRDNRSQP